jgi:hypothetical protein
MPSLMKLRKFASMGSALTFPIQSLVFFCICVGAGLSLERRPDPKKIWRLARQVRVYGDDLIVPVAWVPRVKELFQLLYLKVNSDKTFSAGNFRESCGTDAYGGYEVTPFYVTQMITRASTGSVVAMKDLANNALMKGFWNTSGWLASSLPKKYIRLLSLVPPDLSAFGLITFGQPVIKRKRYNSKLQRYEFLALTDKSVTRGTRSEGFANLLQYFTEDPSSARDILSDWESGRFARAESREALSWVECPGEMSVHF